MALLLFLAACAPTKETFPDQFAAQWCARMEECSKADYEGRYDSRSECVDDVADEIDDALGECDFDEDDALECLQDMSRETCDDVDDVYAECLWGGTAYECDLGDFF